MASLDSFDSLLEAFSRACQAFNVKPNQETERPILEVQQMPEVLEFCRHVLDRTQDPVVLFHTFRIILQAMIANWAEMSPELIFDVKSMILTFGTQYAESQPPYVLNQISTVYAALTKRSWMSYILLDGASELVALKQMLNEDMTQLIAVGRSVSLKARLFGVSVLDAVVTEFECSRKSSTLDLGAELHSLCFESFQDDDLGPLFVLVVSQLMQLVSEYSEARGSTPGGQGGPKKKFSSNDVVSSSDLVELLARTLQLCTHILSWPFGQVGLILGIFMGNSMQLLKPPFSWRDILITPDMEVLTVYSSLYMLVRNHNAQLARLAREGMMQLSSLSGDVYGTTEEMRAEPRRAWINAFSSLITQLLANEDLSNAELRDKASIVQRFFGATSLQSLVDAIGTQNLEVMMELVCRRTCDTMDRLLKAAENGGTGFEGVDASDHFDDADVEDTVLGDAVDTWLQAWAAWSSDSATTTFPNLPFFMFEVFNSYVFVRLGIARAELIRSETSDRWVNYEIPTAKHDLTNSVIIEQLANVASIARVSPRTSIEHLKRELGSISTAVRGCVERGESSQEMHMKLEELHWLLMIIGHFLCHVNRAELSYIPIPIHRLCNTYDEQGQENDVIALSSQVFEIIQIENMAIEAAQNTGQLVWSPLVAETLAWFLANWSSCYLLISDLSNSASPSLMDHYGANSENVVVVLDELFRKIVINLTGWPGETAVLLRTCNILQLISRLDTLHMSMLSKLSGFNDLFGAWTSGNATMASYPPKVQRKLMSALAHLVQAEGVEDQVSYLNMLIEPVETQFQAIIQSPDFQNSFQSPSTMISLQIVFERLRGLLQSTRGRTYKSVNQIVTHYLSSLVELLLIYKEYHQMVLLILKIYSDYVAYVLCCTYDDSLTLPFKTALHHLLTTAQSINLFKRRNTGGTTALGARYGAEEAQIEQYEELLTLFGILCGIVDDKEEDVAKLSFFSLEVATPHIDAEMLAYPKLCRRYFHFISSIFGVHANQLGNLDDSLFNVVLSALEAGLQQVDEYIQMAALDAIAKVASFNFKMLTQKGIDILQSKHNALGQFITTLLHWLLFEDGFKMELIESASKAYFALVCSEEETYKQTVQSLIEQQPEPSTQQRLIELFENLMNGIELQWTDANKSSFTTHMKSFVPIARGMLHRR
jgi:hypothetical protein